ncbi:MAG: hypothetical protein AAFO96_03470 [Bacteroidota bacterium]
MTYETIEPLNLLPEDCNRIVLVRGEDAQNPFDTTQEESRIVSWDFTHVTIKTASKKRLIIKKGKDLIFKTPDREKDPDASQGKMYFPDMSSEPNLKERFL